MLLGKESEKITPEKEHKKIEHVPLYVRPSKPTNSLNQRPNKTSTLSQPVPTTIHLIGPPLPTNKPSESPMLLALRAEAQKIRKSEEERRMNCKEAEVFYTVK